MSRESFNPSLGINVTGIGENYLEMSIKPGISVFISLAPYNHEDQGNNGSGAQNVEDLFNSSSIMEIEQDVYLIPGHPSHITYEIYLQQLFHEEIFSKVKHNLTLPGRVQTNHQPNDAVGLVNHFCLSLVHRIFAGKVLRELENLVLTSFDFITVIVDDKKDLFLILYAFSLVSLLVSIRLRSFPISS